MHHGIKIVPIERVDFVRLAEFFDSIKDNQFFQPHPFTCTKALELQKVPTKNLYYCLGNNSQVIGYGFLRGWDEGWDDICLGAIIREEQRNKGYGTALVEHLHFLAKESGLKRVRLHINPENSIAMHLYDKLGYKFNGEMFRDEKVGYYDIHYS